MARCVTSPDRTLLIALSWLRRMLVFIWRRARNRALEDLRSAIHNEESERREGEDWSIAGEYVHSLYLHDPRMLPNHQYPIPQREPLFRITRNRRVHRGMSSRNARRCRNHPPNMLIRSRPERGIVAGLSCKFGLASCRSNSSTRKYASELAPHRPFDASRSCSSTLSMCS